MTHAIPYPTPADARQDYPYRAVLTSPTPTSERDLRQPPAAWEYARLLESGEIEVLYDGHGTSERIPGSTVELRRPGADAPADSATLRECETFLANLQPQ